MSEPFVGEIRMFAGNFAPQGWALCDGQLLAVSQNNALFALLGTVYGGDGRTTFGLPDLRGRIPIHVGSGPGLSPRAIGSKAGFEKVTLTANQVTGHSHGFAASAAAAEDMSPKMNRTALATGTNIYGSTGPARPLDAAAIKPGGAAAPTSHENVMPFLCLDFIIALFGVFPSRN